MSRAFQLLADVFGVAFIGLAPVIIENPAWFNHPVAYVAAPLAGLALFGESLRRAFMDAIGRSRPLVVSDDGLSGARLPEAVAWDEIEAAWVEPNRSGADLYLALRDIERARALWDMDPRFLGRVARRHAPPRFWTAVDGYSAERIESAIREHGGQTLSDLADAVADMP